MNMKLSSVFNIIQGHQITDEEIYRSIGLGNTPIYTSSNEIKGYWDKSLITKDDLPCISYPTKANSGEAFVQNKIFDANNTAVLVPLPNWREKIILEWAVLKLSNIFPSVMTSNEGVSYLNKDIVKELEFEVPNRIIQQKELEILSKLKTLHTHCSVILNQIEHIRGLTILGEYQSYQAKNVPISEILDCHNGNTGLTEKQIYQSLLSEKERYEVLSSSTEENTRLGYIPICDINGKELEVFEGEEGILVTRNGNAGKASFLKNGKYAITDHAYILSLKKNIKYQVSLKWIIYQYQPVFYYYSSSSDNGTWNMTGFFNGASIDIPSNKEQQELVTKYEYLELLQDKIANILLNINQISNRQIVS
jgi:Type I restriction modification DNA specificity domain